MSNMKNAHRLTVAIGDVTEDVLMFVCKDFALDIDLDEGEIDLVRINDERTIAVYTPYESPVPNDIVTNALGCLDDHINNVPESELKQRMESDDYMCVNPLHGDGKVECHCGLEDCIHAEVYSSFYYAQDCVVEVYYISKI